MFKAPGQLPPLSLLLDDLPTRCARKIARHLGISTRTLKRYQVEDQAPRVVLLALFFETRWGRSLMDSELEHRHRLHMGYIEALKRENAQLRVQISRLVELVDSGNYGAANAPVFDGQVHVVKPDPARGWGSPVRPIQQRIEAFHLGAPQQVVDHSGRADHDRPAVA